MGKHRKTRAARTPAKLNRTCAICAIAGAAGFGLISLAPTAFADNSSDDGWWLGSGNNTPIGNNGNGNTSQNGAFNGNVMNNQLNLLSPVIGGTAVNAGARIAARRPAPGECRRSDRRRGGEPDGRHESGGGGTGIAGPAIGGHECRV